EAGDEPAQARGVVGGARLAADDHVPPRRIAEQPVRGLGRERLEALDQRGRDGLGRVVVVERIRRVLGQLHPPGASVVAEEITYPVVILDAAQAAQATGADAEAPGRRLGRGPRGHLPAGAWLFADGAIFRRAAARTGGDVAGAAERESHDRTEDP